VREGEGQGAVLHIRRSCWDTLTPDGFTPPSSYPPRIFRTDALDPRDPGHTRPSHVFTNTRQVGILEPGHLQHREVRVQPTSNADPQTEQYEVEMLFLRALAAQDALITLEAARMGNLVIPHHNERGVTIIKPAPRRRGAA